MHIFPLTLKDSKAMSDEKRIELQPLLSQLSYQNISHMMSIETKFLLYTKYAVSSLHST